ncbi:MAG TPA: T9SS type A sorting domain-containing protein [Ignavibacteriaceae bacterium]
MILFLLLTIGSYSQMVTSGNLEDYINSYLSNIPHSSSSNEYQPLPDSVLDNWAQVIEDIVSGNYISADLTAPSFGYQIVKFSDTSDSASKDYVILEKNSASTNFWGTFIFNPKAMRQRLIIQAPHPLYDSNTGKESLIIFKTSGARALFISGTHRCNSSFFTPCSGTTTACSSTSQSYRQSDQAHVVNGTFQKTTEALLQLIENLIVIQPHGFSKQSGDPDLIMSNGTRLIPSSVDYLSLLKENLFGLDNSLTFKIAHIDLTWDRLIATTNTQGRLINGSVNPCNLNPPSTSGRFLHIEQAFPKLRDSKTNWIKFANAVTMTFPEDPLVSVKDDIAQEYDYFLFQNYPNPFNPTTTIKYSIKHSGFVSLKVFNILGKLVEIIVDDIQSIGVYSYAFDASGLSSGVYFVVLNAEGKVISNKMILAK